MKELTERHQYVDYIGGKQMPASDFTHGALDIFGEYVYPDVLKEHCSRQLDFDGEVWYTKNRPVQIETPEQEHLVEVRPLISGETRIIPIPPEELIPMLRDFEKRVYE